jgi:hypothetical protein
VFLGYLGILTGGGVSAAVLVAFALVGILSGSGQLSYWLRRPRRRMHWWFAHMDLMLGSCIAATTAFLVNNSGHRRADASAQLVSEPEESEAPPRPVTWGEDTFDEMASLLIVPVREQDAAALGRLTGERQRLAIQRGIADGTLKRMQTRRQQAAQ